MDALHRVWIDPDVRRFLWDDRVISRETAAAVVDHSLRCWSTRGFGLCVVLLKPATPTGTGAGDPLIGFCGLRPLDDTGDVELLYGLLPAFWGRGLGTEAARAMLRFGFDRAGLRRILAITDAPNVASIGVMIRAGMRFEGRRPHHGLDSIFYVLEREAFETGMRDDVRLVEAAEPSPPEPFP